MREIEVKITKGQRHAFDRYGKRYRINGILIRKDRGGESLFSPFDSEHFCGRFSRGDFFNLVAGEETYSQAFLIGPTTINLL